MRLFVAAELPAAVRERLGAAQRELRTLPLEVRWVRPEGIHLTLVFLGEVIAARLSGIVTALTGMTGAPPGPFALEARGLGSFPGSGRAKVIWVGVTGDLKALDCLRQGVASALRTEGFDPGDRPFHPHLTLGRVQGGRGDAAREELARRASASFGTFEVSAVHLFESELLPGGARYRSLAEFPLGSAGGAS